MIQCTLYNFGMHAYGTKVVYNKKRKEKKTPDIQWLTCPPILSCSCSPAPHPLPSVVLSLQGRNISEASMQDLLELAWEKRSI